MALAQRLNELATANSQGLLNDDEYRLLRQNVFEQYSSNAVIPVESPIVPIARVHVQGSSPTPNQRRTTPKVTPDQPKPLPSPIRAKTNVTSSVANLLRRATGRRTPNSFNDSPTTKDTRKGNGVDHGPTPKDTSKRSIMIPRFHKKPPELPRLRMEVLAGTADPPKLPAIRTVSELRNPPPSPSRQPLSPLHPEKSISTIRDVFDDENLRSATDIRNAIALTEEEGRRLVEAFNNLESTTTRRIQKQKAHRLPTTTPANINILLGGKEWREHRLVSSPSSPLLDSKSRHILSSVESNSDGVSIRSGSSNRTSLSQSRSISSLPKQPPISPLSPHFRASSIAMPRKNSVSSISSSQAPSHVSPGMLGVSTLSRSTSHLALRRLKDSEMSVSTETVGQIASDPADGDEDAELSDIRKRREDLIGRYTARLEFLNAKLKGAELHEKLLKK
ncbi:hypothetical protein M413DRAFT_445922 [Hebeloma cylindrosporum]|uniref:Uncharacterized protein n=1 Tax=Hebeloma cylindrosporum TaxID=76867 RepID=A0A0C3BUW9_HEBCY|nr:hypothetical protein M413DRAFT_445922 [Hebeloma cylindrosporum h7]